MAVIQRFEDIDGWQKARELVREVYKIRSKGALSRDYALTDQLCRAAISTMSNTAEGFSRGSDSDFARFLDMSKASASELQSLLYVALDANYIRKEQFERLYGLAEEVKSLIGGFTKYLRSPSGKRGSSTRRRPASSDQ